MNNRTTAKAFGIDLGTTNSVAAIYRNGKVEMVVDKNGSCITPSCVYFPRNGTPPYVCGFVAKDRVYQTPKEVVHSCKRLIGAKYSDPIVGIMQKSVPFSIVDDGNNKPMVAFHQNEEEKERYPEQVSSYILEHLKKLTQAFAGFDIKDVVITVPARYTQIQRQIVRDAASIAGLNALDIIPEPVAAAYAYADVMNIGNATVKDEKNVLIYDLGGGTFDVTIMKINGMEFTELALGGDPLLGGSDFDRLIRDDLIKAYREEAKEEAEEAGEEYRELSKKSIDKLLKKCEDAKIDLKSVMETEITVSDDIEWVYNLTRGHMNDLIGGKIDESIRLCDEAIAKAGLTVDDIDAIVLVGGSTRLLIVEEKLKEHFPQLEIKYTVNPDECVAVGATKYAYALSNKVGVPVVHDVPNPVPEVPNPLTDEMPNPPLREVPNPPLREVPNPPLREVPNPPLREVSNPPPVVPNPPPIEVPRTVMVKSICPSNIGIQGSEGEMIVLISAGDELPCRKMQTVSNTEDEVKRIPIRVYQGNDPMCANNTKLKQVILTIKHPGKAGENVFEISCSLDQMGNLTLGVKEANKNGPEKEIRNFQTTWTAEEIQGLRQQLQNDTAELDAYNVMMDEHSRLEREASEMLGSIPEEWIEEFDAAFKEFGKTFSVEGNAAFERTLNTFREFV